MKDDLKTELDAVLDTFDESDKATRSRSKSSNSQAVQFVESFYVTRESIIWPAMIEVGKVLKKRGHDTRITQTDDDFHPSGTGDEARIALYIYPHGIGFDSQRALDYPSIAFIASRYNLRIWTNTNTNIPGRRIGEIGVKQDPSRASKEFALEEITSELVQEQIVGLVKNVFSKSR